MEKNKPTLPAHKFVELPDDVVNGQIKEALTEQVRENYDVQYVTKVEGGWLIKLTLLPRPAFAYKKGERK